MALTKIGDAGMPAGAVLQVKTAVDTSYRSTTSQTFVVASNTAQVSITPLSSTSKFLILCNGALSANDGNDGWYATIFRDSTNLGDSTTGLCHGNSVPATSANFFPFSMTVLDSPSTTSAITYGLRIRNYNADSDGSATTRLGEHLAGTSNAIPTHIVVMEVAA
jgi:hypothetical protein|tara:strand:+ start:31 stop:522 length:492 start_codon:yes stop_codon:yes gene_type:complete